MSPSPRSDGAAASSHSNWITAMDVNQAGPSRTRQPASGHREPDSDIDLQALSFLFSSAQHDDGDVPADAIVNENVNGIFDDLQELQALLSQMKGWTASEIMQGFESAYTAVDQVHASISGRGLLEVVEQEVADAMRRSLRELRQGILALEENLEDDEDKTFVIDMIAALPELDDDIEEQGKGKGRATARDHGI